MIQLNRVKTIIMKVSTYCENCSSNLVHKEPRSLGEGILDTSVPKSFNTLLLPVSCLFNSGSSNLMIRDSNISSLRVSRS